MTNKVQKYEVLDMFSMTREGHPDITHSSVGLWVKAEDHERIVKELQDTIAQYVADAYNESVS